MIYVPTAEVLSKNKVIMIICDGTRVDASYQEFGYVNNLCDNNLGVKGISICDSPSVSKTNYATLCTGVPAIIHGITSNLVLGKSKMERNIFRELNENNKTTAVVGSSWFYDLYGKDDKYNYIVHKELNNDPGEFINFGRFHSDDVPESIDSTVEGLAHNFQVSDHLIYKYIPDFLLIHLLSPDKIGHEKGIGREYRAEINMIDGILGAILPRWLDMGYNIIVTSDHGMDSNKNHGGVKCEVMETPFYVLSKKGWKPNLDNMKHIDVAPLIIERILPNSDFRSYRDKLIKDNNYRFVNNCIK